MSTFLFLLTGLSSVGHAEWRLNVDQSLTSSFTQNGMDIHFNNIVALSPFQKGSQLSFLQSFDIGGKSRFSRIGIGIRHPINNNLSVALHGVNITQYGENIDYENRSGLETSINWRMKTWDKTHLGLSGIGGTSTTQAPPWWWGGIGLHLGFGK